MPAESWPCGATTTTTSGRIPHWAIGVQQKRAGRLSNLRAPRPARLPHPKPTTINPKDVRYERGTTGGAGQKDGQNDTIKVQEDRSSGSCVSRSPVLQRRRFAGVREGGQLAPSGARKARQLR